MKPLDSLKLTALHLLPKNAVSRAVGVLSDIRLPSPAQGVVNSGFAKFANIDVTEAESPPGQYGSLNAFFTRKLRDGMREIEGDAKTLVSPADGRLSAYGKIESDTLVQAKGREYRLLDFVDSGADAGVFEGGQYLTVYLSPRDYHRVHSPVAGTVDRVTYIPGHLFPVNPFAVDHIDELFAVNERLITYVDSEFGRVAIVMVGATCVGRMTLAFDSIETNTSFRRREDRDLSQSLDRGEEVGMFNLGSTVVLLLENPDLNVADNVKAGASVRMGEAIGTFR